MERKTCFFIWHRGVPDSLFPILDVEVERYIAEHGITEFFVGRYGRFDSLAAKCIKKAKTPPRGDAHIAVPLSSA